MPFGDVEPDTGQHKNAGQEESPIETALANREREGRSGKRSDGKIGARASRAEASECLHEENQAQAIPKEPDDSNPAISTGLVSAMANLARGVLAPKRTAAPKALRIPL